MTALSCILNGVMLSCNWERVRAAGTKLLCKPAGDHRTTPLTCSSPVAFKVYDVDRDGYISNGELFLVLKMMVGNNLKVRAGMSMAEAEKCCRGEGAVVSSVIVQWPVR